MWSLLLVAAYATPATEIIAGMDAAMNQASDQTIRWQVVNQLPGKKAPKNMRFSVQVKGPKTLTSFEAPADLAGTRVLVLSRSQMYIYLPAYNKVRRIASHVTQQGFMGTTYSHDDMNASRYGDVYSGELLSEDDSSWVVSLTPKPEVKAPYARVEITIEKSRHLPLVIKDYSDKGVHLKTETRSDYACEQGVCLAGVMRMEDHTRPGAWTELRRQDWTVNPGLPDSLFTTRTLQRGE